MWKNVISRGFAKLSTKKRITLPPQFQKSPWYHEHYSLDTGGVIIPSEAVELAMQQTCLRFGIYVTCNQIKDVVCSSKSECFRAILRKYCPIDCPIVEQDFVHKMMTMYPGVQLNVFKKHPHLSKIIDLDGLQTTQASPTRALVVTSMFPEQIMRFLTRRFHDQGFFPDAILSPKQDLLSTTTRSDLFRKGLEMFPARKTIGVFDTFADCREVITNFPEAYIFGAYGFSAERPENIQEKFLDLGCRGVIHSTKYLLSCRHYMQD